MFLVQVIATIFVLFALIGVILKFKENKITIKEFFFWSLVWIFVEGIILFPESMSFFAKTLGVGRGVDVIIYLALILLFYMVFRIYVRMEKIEQDITSFVKTIALRKK